MTTFDTVVAVVVGVSVFYSVTKGMVREIFSLLAVASGYYAAAMFQRETAAYLGKILANQTAARIVGFVLIFLCAAIVVSFIGKGIRRLMKSAGGLSLFDRVMGGLIGLVKGLAIVIIVLAPLELFPDFYRSITRGSMIAPSLESVSKQMRKSAGDQNGILDKLPNISLQGAEEKLKELKDLEKMTDKLKLKAKEFSLSDGKPQDEYTKEDKKQLEKMLKSIDKE